MSGKDADLDFVVALVAEDFERFHHLGQAVEAEETSLDGDDDFIAGAQGVEGDEAYAWRAIDDAPTVGFLHLLKGAQQTIFAAGATGEDLLEGGELDVGRRKIEIAGDLPDDLRNRADLAVALFDERVVDGALDLLLGDRQADAAVALGVHVDEQCLVPEARQTGREVDAGGCFSAATLLIDDRKRTHGHLPWSMRGQSFGRCCGMARNGG